LLTYSLEKIVGWKWPIVRDPNPLCLECSMTIRCSAVAAFVAVLILCAADPALAASKAGSDSSKIDRLVQRLESLEKLVKSQQKELDEQNRKISAQDEELKSAKKKTVSAEAAPEAKGANPAPTPSRKPVVVASESTTVPGTSIQGPAKSEQEERPEINVLPDAGGVLTPKGVLMYENSAEYTNTTSNLFSFNGVQLAQAVLVGAISASSARRQVIQDSSRFRMGLTNRLEADVRVPYIYRNDATTTTSSGSSSKAAIEGHGLGDIDMGLAYQLNRGLGGWPFFVGNLRYKSTTGDGPYDVPFDANNISTRLPLGTGFNSVEGSLTAIKVTDPAVLFGNLGYVQSIGEDINKNFNDTHIGKVSPGPVVNASGGLGFSINQDSSFTLGYKHSYVFPTYQQAYKISDGSNQESRSDTLQVGAFLFGASYRVNPKVNLNFTAEIGATRDAPDVHVGLRVPIEVGKLY
jgi:hypothetical protein